MKNSIRNISLYIGLVFLMTFEVVIAQTAEPKKEFEPIFSEAVRGNVTLIANNVLSRNATGNFNGGNGNHDFDDNVFCRYR